MRFALLRVSRPDWDAEAFVREHGLTTAPFWRAAGLVADGTSTRSGFNLAIAGPSRGHQPERPIGEWLRQNRSVLEAIGRTGANAELHIGLGVEEREPFTTLGQSRRIW